MDITLSEYAGDGGLSEVTMKALVTRVDGDADNLAQMARLVWIEFRVLSFHSIVR